MVRMYGMNLFCGVQEKGWATKLAAGVSDGGHERSTAAWLFQNTITLTQGVRTPSRARPARAPRACFLRLAMA